MKKAFRIDPCQITGVRTKADGSLGINISTPELPTKSKAEVMDLMGELLEITFQGLDHKAIVEELRGEEKRKTPSGRMRAVLYVLYKQGYRKQGDEVFEAYYARAIERMIDALKQHIDDGYEEEETDQGV